MELGGDPGGDLGTSTTGSAHSGNDLQLAHVVLDNLLAIVPKTGVEPLTKELDRWLGAISILLGHVEVVNKADGLQLGVPWLELVLGSAVKVALDHFLSSLGAGARREVDSERKLERLKLSEESLLDQDSLTDTRVSDKEDAGAGVDQGLGDKSVTGPIDSLNVDFVEVLVLE